MRRAAGVRQFGTRPRISVEAAASLEECDAGERGQPVHQPVLESQVTGL